LARYAQVDIESIYGE